MYAKDVGSSPLHGADRGNASIDCPMYNLPIPASRRTAPSLSSSRLAPSIEHVTSMPSTFSTSKFRASEPNGSQPCQQGLQVILSVPSAERSGHYLIGLKVLHRPEVVLLAIDKEVQLQIRSGRRRAYQTGSHLSERLHPSASCRPDTWVTA
eukprot:768800-Hanusia_phi.AAC.8